MVNVISQSLSALIALDTRSKVTANNIANISTDEFQPSRVVLQESPSGGVNAAVQESSGAVQVDLSKEVVDMMITEAGFKMNIKVLQTGEEMTEALIDIIA